MKGIRLCLLLGAAAAWGQAPTLLSRGERMEFPAATARTIFRPFAGVISGYDSAPLTPVAGAGGGAFQELDGGLDLVHSGRRASLRLDYRFGLRHYPHLSRLDRSNQAVNLDARFRLSRRWALAVRDVGSSSSFGGSLEADPSPSAGFFPEGGPEVFHARTIANTALVDVAYFPTARASISLGGDGFLVERQHRGLADVAGWRARADFAYRYGRRKTLSAAYSFTRFEHSRSFGGAEYAVYAAGHSARLGKRSELDLLAGAGLLRSAGVRSVELDPEIARILGTSRGAEVFRLRTWMPHLAAGWTRGLGRGALRVQYARMVSDGGGLSGLARQNQVSLAVAMPAARSWRWSGQLAGRSYRSLDTLLYDASTAAAGFTLARRLGPRLEAVARYHYAFYHFDRGLLRHFHRHQLAGGVVFYPGDPASY